MNIITLTTDFGTRDWFVGAMKGVIESLAPRIRVIDLSHDLLPGDIRGGAFTLAASRRFFPKGSIHLVLVDGGVGSRRRLLRCRRPWFKCGILAAIGVLLTALYQLRVGRLRELESLRVQIAADLHDDVGARLTKVAMVTELVDRETPGTDWNKPSIQNLSRTTREVIQAMDEIVWTINPKNDSLEDLTNYIFHYAQDYFQNSGVRCRLDVPAKLLDYPMSTQQRHNLFMAVKEAMNHVLKHANATEVRIGLAMEDSKLADPASFRFVRHGSYRRNGDLSRRRTLPLHDLSPYLLRADLLHDLLPQTLQAVERRGRGLASRFRPSPARPLAALRTEHGHALAERLGRHAMLLQALALESLAHLDEPLVYDHFETFAAAQEQALGIGTAVGQDSWFIYDLDYVLHRRGGRRTPAQQARKPLPRTPGQGYGHRDGVRAPARLPGGHAAADVRRR